jgi:hypothetical protein
MIQSFPRMIEFPELGFQQSDWMIQFTDFIRFLQSDEANLEVEVVVLSQVSTETWGMYLSFTIEGQILACVNTRHREFATSV